MPNQTILEQIRTPLATALSSVAGNVYGFVPETVIPPAVVVVPDSPYLEFETISKTNIQSQNQFYNYSCSCLQQQSCIARQYRAINHKCSGSHSSWIHCQLG
jgi:hypothetical protein